MAVVEFLGGLAEVPHVAVDVLGIPVVGVLGDLIVDVGGVAHDDRGDSHDVAPLVEHFDLDAFRDAFALAFVHPARPGSQREVGVVDDVHEVGGIDRGGVVAAVTWVDDGRLRA